MSPSPKERPQQQPCDPVLSDDAPKGLSLGRESRYLRIGVLGAIALFLALLWILLWADPAIAAP